MRLLWILIFCLFSFSLPVIKGESYDQETVQDEPELTALDDFEGASDYEELCDTIVTKKNNSYCCNFLKNIGSRIIVHYDSLRLYFKQYYVGYRKKLLKVVRRLIQLLGTDE
jgi:hypothetical protein